MEIQMHSYTPANNSPAALQKHANALLEAIGLNLSRNSRACLAAEIRNAAAPIAILTDLELHELTPEDLAAAKDALRRILALADAIVK